MIMLPAVFYWVKRRQRERTTDEEEKKQTTHGMRKSVRIFSLAQAIIVLHHFKLRWSSITVQNFSRISQNAAVTHKQNTNSISSSGIRIIISKAFCHYSSTSYNVIVESECGVLCSSAFQCRQLRLHTLIKPKYVRYTWKSIYEPECHSEAMLHSIIKKILLKTKLDMLYNYGHTDTPAAL